MEKIKQFTKKQAIALAESKIWEKWSDEQIVKCQLYQTRICTDWSRFKEAMEKVLGRSIWTHEFGSDGRLKDEYEGKKGKPTFEEIVNLIPEEKRIIIGF